MASEGPSGYSQMPNIIWDEYAPAIHPSIITIYLFLLRKQGANESAWPGYPLIESSTRINRRYIKACLTDLATLRLLLDSYRKKGMVHYVMNRDPDPLPDPLPMLEMSKTKKGNRSSSSKSKKAHEIEALLSLPLTIENRNGENLILSNENRNGENLVGVENRNGENCENRNGESRSKYTEVETENTHKEGMVVCGDLGLSEKPRMDIPAERSEEPTSLSCEALAEPPNQPPRTAAEIWALDQLNDLLGEPHEMPVDGLPAARAYSQDDIALVLRFLSLAKDSPFSDSRGQRVGHYWRIATPKSVFGLELFKTRLAQAKGRFKNDVPTIIKTACAPGTHEFDDRRVDMAGAAHGCCLNCKKWHPIGNAQGVAS